MAVEWLPGPLSLLAYDVLWHERYGDCAKPSVLNCESPGTSTTERGKLEDQAHAELRRAGYLPGSKLVSELHGALDALAHPVNEFTLRWESATPLRAMAACSGDREVVAIFAFPTRASGAAPQRPVLWVSRLVHGPLAPNLVSFLPPREPASIRSLSVRAQSLAHADDNARWQPQRLREQPFTFVQKALLDEHEPPEACAAFAKLAASSLCGRGELGVAVLSRGGRRETAHRKIILADTEDGRFVLTTLGEHVTVRGGGISDLTQELQRQHGELVRHVCQAPR